MMDAQTISDRLEKAVAYLTKELQGIRTGRATPSIVEGLLVEYYGTPTPLIQLATINAPEPKLLVIEAWDPTVIPSIEKSIRQSTLGLSPAVDGQRIRLSFPPLTEERRQELVKIAKQKMESARVTVRGIRDEAMRELRQAEKNGELSEDALAQEEKEIQKRVDAVNAELEGLLEEKQKEILSV